jgi:hypothetical protein
MNPIDYGRSFTIAGGERPGNVPRFWIDSRTRIIDDANETYEDYYRTDACVTERTFGAGQIFPEYTYMGSRIWGSEKTWFYRHKEEAEVLISNTRPQAMVYESDSIWGPVRHHLVDADVEEIEDDSEILEATREGRVLIGQTEIQNAERKLRAIFEFPIKTMNTVGRDGFEWLGSINSYAPVDPGNRAAVYQVDTGPIAFAHLDREFESHHERIQMAYVAFNAPDLASFMLFEPASLLDDDGNVKARVNGYHKPVLLPATNRVYALKG